MVKRIREIEDTRALGHEIEIQDRDDPFSANQHVAEPKVAEDELPGQVRCQRDGLSGCAR